MGVESIRKEMNLFQTSVRNLSAGVGNASSLWKDEKFSELSASVAEVAKNSRDVLISGERCCSSLDKFNQIAAEKY